MCPEQAGFITIQFRSFVTPAVHVEGFVPGKKIQLKLKGGVSLKELVQDFFSKNHNIGFVVVNGRVVKDKVLLDGDSVEIYPFLGGG